ncbi:MAG: acyltransferase family protein [Pseudomonadota bacterium]
MDARTHESFEGRHACHKERRHPGGDPCRPPRSWLRRPSLPVPRLVPVPACDARVRKPHERVSARESATVGFGEHWRFLFLVVSGFVISEALDLFYCKSFGRFLVNRFLRIYPTWWVAAALAYALFIGLGIPTIDIGLLPIRVDPWALFVNMTLLPAYLRQGNNLLVIPIAGWVVIELIFYILAGLVFALADRQWCLGAVAVAALAFYPFVWWMNGYVRFYGILQFAPYFLLGSAVYFYATRRRFHMFLLGFFALVQAGHHYYQYNLHAPMIDSVTTTVLFVAGVALLCALIAVPPSDRVKLVDRRLGDVTYAVYLLHVPIISISVFLSLAGPIAFAFVFLVTLAASTLVHAAAERPLMGLRNVLRGRRLYD